jgi:hypothetical protein
LLDALVALGWVVDLRQPVAVSGGPNPTRVDLRHAQDRRRLLLYSWFVTHEGKGRAKNDFRIQTTRTHDGPLAQESGRVTIGVGWDRRREVFAAFDGWTKRQTGSSSSVHIKAALLEHAKTAGWAVEPPRWDARVSFDRDNAGRFLLWIGEMSGLREALLHPVDYTIHDADHADIVGDIWAGQPTGWLRVGDRLVMIDKRGGLMNDTLWRIAEMEAQQVKTASGRYNRTRIQFACERIGRVGDEAALEALR